MTELTNNELYVKLLEAIKQEGLNTKEDIKKEIIIENKKILEHIEIQNKRIAELEEKFNKLELKHKNLEKQFRKNNVVIFGLEINKDLEDNLPVFILDKIEELLDIKLQIFDISNIYLMKTEKGTPVKVEFVSYLKKSLILQNANKLKGSKIFISQDLSYEDRQNLTILRKNLKYAKNQNYSAKIKNNKLIVNDNIYTVDQLMDMEIDEQNVNNELEQINEVKSVPSKSSETISKNICNSGISFDKPTDRRKIINTEPAALKRKKVFSENCVSASATTNQNTPTLFSMVTRKQNNK